MLQAGVSCTKGNRERGNIIGLLPDDRVAITEFNTRANDAVELLFHLSVCHRSTEKATANQ